MTDIDELTEEEEIVKDCLDQWGFKVVKIPVGKEKRPDFHVSKDTDRYLVEVKEKIPSDDLINRRQEDLRSGKIFEETDKIIRQSKLTKIIYEAKEQLIAYEPEADYFRLIWFVLRAHNSNQIKEVIEANLFGKKHVCDWGTEGSNNIECYYFGESDFFRYKDVLDSAVILIVNGNEAESVLCVNDHSPRYEKFKGSLLHKLFGRAAVVDAKELDKTGDIYLVDSDVDRSNKQALFNFIKKKYSLSDKIMDMEMASVTATVLVPNDPK